MFGDPLYIAVILVGVVLSGITSMMVKSSFARGEKVGLSRGYTGRDVAEAILRSAGIRDVRVVEHRGFLSDHYNPADKTLNLSSAVYHGINASAAGVAAHETGHAIQHAQGYAPLRIRSAVVPVASLGCNVGPWLIILGIVLGAAEGLAGPTLVAKIGVWLSAASTFFTLVTVPVEYDASARAKKLLGSLEITRTPEETAAVKDVLSSAALTYVAAAITSVLTLLYWAMRAGLLGGRRND